MVGKPEVTKAVARLIGGTEGIEGTRMVPTNPTEIVDNQYR
jgi:hypothetical protein